MVLQDTVLVRLVKLVDRIPVPAPPPRRREHPVVCSDRPFPKALVIMIVRRLGHVHELLSLDFAQR
jgi:hypothetical protein